MGWVVNATPRPLCPRERPGTHCIGGLVGPRAGLDKCGKYRLPPGWLGWKSIKYNVGRSSCCKQCECTYDNSVLKSLRKELVRFDHYVTVFDVAILCQLAGVVYVKTIQNITECHARIPTNALTIYSNILV
jgi:hypothetical protein